MELSTRSPTPPVVSSPHHDMSGSVCSPFTGSPSSSQQQQNTVTTMILGGIPIVCLHMDGKDRLCLAQISNTLLKDYSYNEIHNRRVALGITCVQCTPVQLEILRRAGAMPVSSRRCGMITKREAERLVKSFLGDHTPPQLPENFAFSVAHTCGWGCKGQFIPARYNSSRAKCIKCCYCAMFFSPNKFIFHFHRTPSAKYRHPDAANFNSWRRHLDLDYTVMDDDLVHAWEDVKAMFNGGSRKRVLSPGSPKSDNSESSDHDHLMMSPKRQRMTSEDINVPNHAFNFPQGQFQNPSVLNHPGTVPPFVNQQHSSPPVFPFMPPAGNHIRPPSQDLVPTSAVEKYNNLADMWKNKNTAAYCNPFNFFWAKNMTNMDNGLMSTFRGMFPPEILAKSHEHFDGMKGNPGIADKQNRLSAFKPVGLFGFGNWNYENRLEDVTNTVVSPLSSSTPSPPLSDNIEDIDVTDSGTVGNTQIKDEKVAERQSNTTFEHSDKNNQYNDHKQGSDETESLSNNNNTSKVADSQAMTQCPGHVNTSGNCKRYSVEFLASTENKASQQCPSNTNDMTNGATYGQSRVQPTSSTEVTSRPTTLGVDINNIYNMSKEQLQSELISIIAKRDRLEKSVQFMKDFKQQGEGESGQKSPILNTATQSGFKEQGDIMHSHIGQS